MSVTLSHGIGVPGSIRDFRQAVADRQMRHSFGGAYKGLATDAAIDPKAVDVHV